MARLRDNTKQVSKTNIALFHLPFPILSFSDSIPFGKLNLQSAALHFELSSGNLSERSYISMTIESIFRGKRKGGVVTNRFERENWLNYWTILQIINNIPLWRDFKVLGDARKRQWRGTGKIIFKTNDSVKWLPNKMLK